MKVLGVKQFHQKTYKMLPINNSRFSGILGDIPAAFILVVYGYSGNGKTEFCMQLAKELTKHGKVAWLSYEQRHDYDLQRATIRNNMDEHTGNFLVIDPIDSIKPNTSYLEDIDNYLKKRNSPDFVFIDSLDYTGWREEEYKFLKHKYGKKKSFIFITHSNKQGTQFKKRVSEQVLFDGGAGILVRDFIAQVSDKNRYGGFEPYVVYEEMARKRNPSFFLKQVQEPATPKKSKTTKH